MFKKSDFHCMLDTQVSLIHVRKRCIQYMMFQKTEEKDLLVLCCFFFLNILQVKSLSFWIYHFCMSLEFHCF